jgi:response regulator RpfG family c-di-GMP phosphodiesterase/GGDEF domain-containing protein
MEPSSGAIRGALVAIGVTVVAAATVAIGAFSGIGIWFVAVLGGGVLGGVATLTAIGISSASHGSLAPAREAMIDRVTGLPNAETVRIDLDAALTERDDAPPLTLYVCALQGLKKYNDAYGDACGDALLAWLGRKLRVAIAERGDVYRMRGGSFAVLAAGSQEVRTAAATALQEVGEGFMISSVVGEATLASEAHSAEEAIELADRRAQPDRSAPHPDSELRPPDDPIDTLRLVRPRYDVAALATRIGRRMGVPIGDLDDLEAAAHLRDVGNMAVPSPVLNHASELPGHEWAFIRLHTVVGERLLAANFGMEAVAKLVRSSHERWDGSGYPDGLSGTQIPLGSRVVFVCSAFQDMTSERPHRPAMGAAEALAELENGAGTQFDPEVVRAFQEEFAASPSLTENGLVGRGRKPMRTLVADDDPASRFLLQRAVEAAGHECIAVEDGESALETFRSARPDVVISDWQLPQIGGQELCRRIREDSTARQPFFVIMVALDDGERVRRALLAGADDFLTKPFDRQDLVMLLEAAAGIFVEREAS